MDSFDFFPRTRVIFGDGALQRLGSLARHLGFTRTLIVSDPEIVKTGLAVRAAALLGEAGIASFTFQDFAPNPDTRMVENGRRFAVSRNIDYIVCVWCCL
jgi:alcohol dehydrogenase class IV